MLRWFFLCLTFIAFCGCNSYRVKKLIKGGACASENYQASVPFDTLLGGHIVIEARINGSDEPARFLFDTGASDCWISEAFAAEIGFEPRGRVEIYAGEGEWKETPVGVFNSCMIGDARFENILVGVEPNYEHSVWACKGLIGTLGGSLFRHAKWKIDYERQTLTLTDNLANFPELEAAKPAPFTQPRMDPRPFLEIKIGKEKIGPLLLDTGFDGAVLLDKTFASGLDSAHLAGPSRQEIDNLVQKAHGAALDTITSLLLDVDVQNVRCPGQQVSLIKDIGGAMIGNRLLGSRTVYLDYETSSCWLLPGAKTAQRARNLTFGFLPAYTGEDYWLTGRLLLGGPADNAGLAFGDTIWTINGQKPSAYFQDYCGFEAWSVKYIDATETVELVFGQARKKATLRKSPFFDKE